MNRLPWIFILLFMCFTLLTAQSQTPFQRGVNLSNWFQSSSVQEIEFSRYTYEDFVDIQTLGVDVIRLPINLHGLTSGDPDYTIDPLLYVFLDEIVDWTELLDLHLILDNHSFDPNGSTSPSVHTILRLVWTQMAEHFIDRGPNLYFEILNEPQGISDLFWNTIQQNTIQVIRDIDPDRTLIVGPAGWNSYNNLSEMPVYTDDNLIYTFHFYDPFIFTHQGATWTDPSMGPLSGVPFPYDSENMPDCPPELVGTWIQSNMASYASSGSVENMYSLLDIAVAFKESRNVPVYCGEFGVYMRNSENQDRVQWYDAVTHYLDSVEIGWTMWDYHGGFGLFEAGGTDMFDHDLNIPLVEAMGFNAPPQTDFVLQPDSTGFYLFSDFLGQNISTDHVYSGTLDMYTFENPHSGEICIYWSDPVQYDRMGFEFGPYRDLSSLVANDYLLTLWIKSSGTPAGFDMRFVDTKSALPEDHPWRMGVTLAASDLNWDGEWQYVQIPLNVMQETGSWDNAWFEPAGLFDWSKVRTFELVAEHGDMLGRELWFDDIRIVDAVTASTHPGYSAPSTFILKQNYPNPFNPSTSIRFALPETSQVRLTVYDIAGRVVSTLVDEALPQGWHETTWDAGMTSQPLADSGVYFARIEAGSFSQTLKMLYLK